MSLVLFLVTFARIVLAGVEQQVGDGKAACLKLYLRGGLHIC